MVWYVALGGALGSVARFLLGTLVQARAGSGFPAGTLAVNVTGSLLLGFLMEYTLAGASASREARAFLATGLCGGYTTFSTFSFETVRLIQDGDHRRAAVYLVGSVVLAVAATWAGLVLARWILEWRRGL